MVTAIRERREVETAAARNLYQRLADVGREVAIKVTGKTAQGTATMSITDVERGLGDLLSEHGVVTGYGFNEPPVYLADTKPALWQADITIWLSNADDPADCRQDRAIDVGTSPSAAVSFALKRYYRALFHLADEGDEKREVGQRREPAAAQTRQRAPEPKAPEVSEDDMQRLYNLAARIPDVPKSISEVDELVHQYGYSTVYARCLTEHERRCGKDCEHIQPENGRLPL